MKIKNPMLVVTDIDKSVEFYKKVFGLHVIMDFGANKTLTGGLALQTLDVDEYEAIRLIDREGFSQEQCGEYMRIARTTVQQIYAAARKKLADALVEGLPLRIEGGDFTVCSGNSTAYGCRNCYQQKIHPMHEKPKGDHIMRIAVTYENGEIFQHFGHTEQFKIYDVEDGNIISSEVVDAGGSGHGALAGVLSALKVDALICGGIGGGAQMALSLSLIHI